MLLKKSASKGEKSGVAFINGKVRFQGVSLNVYSFAVDGILIDTGAQSLKKYFEAFIDEVDFHQVMLTHFHEDHTGCAAYAVKSTQQPIYLDQKSIQSCSLKADYPLYRQLFWGRRKPFHAQEMPETFTSNTATWDAIDTPGHAHDHKAFLNRETGQLFTGDLFVQERTKVVMTDESIPQIIDSIKRVLTYDFEEMFCSHAGYVENGRVALTRKLDYLLSIQHDVITLHEKGQSAKEICKKLYPKKYPIIKFSGGEWDSRHIVSSILRGQHKREI